ncbi:MAG: tRNA (adenosine(37)-N6)-dimethylallyltransferase MiaA [Thermoanaerobaculia bacterium]
MLSRIFAIVGPTAAGKSALALEFAAAVGGEIVNADALQVYRGFDIGTAKPSVEEQRSVPHHLIDILDPAERYSAGEFSRRAHEVLRDIERRGKVAILVGGSGLYLRALWSGIAPLPASDAAVRAMLLVRLESAGLPVLFDELARVDPATARRLGRGDTQRILRALEVALATGEPLSSWIARQPFGASAVAMRKVGLTLPRGVLYDAIAVRVRSMLDRGWLDEVRELLERGVERGSPAFQAIGYRQWVEFLDGECEFETALQRVVTLTRRFAKRQETWFRKEAGIVWWDARSTGECLASMKEMVEMADMTELARIAKMTEQAEFTGSAEPAGSPDGGG